MNPIPMTRGRTQKPDPNSPTPPPALPPIQQTQPQQAPLPTQDNTQQSVQEATNTGARIAGSDEQALGQAAKTGREKFQQFSETLPQTQSFGSGDGSKPLLGEDPTQFEHQNEILNYMYRAARQPEGVNTDAETQARMIQMINNRQLDTRMFTPETLGHFIGLGERRDMSNPIAFINAMNSRDQGRRASAWNEASQALKMQMDMADSVRQTAAAQAPMDPVAAMNTFTGGMAQIAKDMTGPLNPALRTMYALSMKHLVTLGSLAAQQRADANAAAQDTLNNGKAVSDGLKHAGRVRNMAFMGMANLYRGGGGNSYDSMLNELHDIVGQRANGTAPPKGYVSHEDAFLTHMVSVMYPNSKQGMLLQQYINAPNRAEAFKALNAQGLDPATVHGFVMGAQQFLMQAAKTGELSPKDAYRGIVNLQPLISTDVLNDYFNLWSGINGLSATTHMPYEFQDDVSQSILTPLDPKSLLHGSAVGAAFVRAVPQIAKELQKEPFGSHTEAIAHGANVTRQMASLAARAELKYAPLLWKQDPERVGEIGDKFARWIGYGN